MKTLLVINDGTPQGDHAAKFALAIARGLEANILVADVCKATSRPKEKIFIKTADDGEVAGEHKSELVESLAQQSRHHEGLNRR